MKDILHEMKVEQAAMSRFGRDLMQWHYERERKAAQVIASVWMAVADQVKEW